VTVEQAKQVESLASDEEFWGQFSSPAHLAAAQTMARTVPAG
jgi:hypothetical protein